MLQLSDEAYPEQETEIIVQGTFETYKEPNDETLYCRITDADMQIFIAETVILPGFWIILSISLVHQKVRLND